LPGGKLPIIPGHEIVGRIDALGAGSADLPSASEWESPGWAILAASVFIALAAPKILCDRPLFTGYTRDGGYATAAIGRRTLCFSTGGRRRGHRSGATALRRPDRLAVAGDGRRGQEAGPLWIRRRGPYHCASGSMARPPYLRVHAGKRSGNPGFRTQLGRGMGWRLQ